MWIDGFLFDATPEGEIPIRALEEDASKFAIELEHSGPREEQTPDAGTNERLEILIHGTSLAVGTLDTHEYLECFLEMLVASFSAKYAVALIPGARGSGASSITIHRHPDATGESVELNRKLINTVRTQENTVLAMETRTSASESVQHHWVLVAPFAAGDHARGVVYLEVADGEKPSGIDEDDLELLHALAGQAGMAIERGELIDELLMRSRLAAMGETVAAISHGIKNILQGLRGGADAVGMAIDRGDLEMAGKGWTVLARNLDRIQALTMNMLGFARYRSLEIEPTSLAQLAQEAVELLEPVTKRASIEIVLDFPDDMPPIPIDSAGILQALLNLLSNAVDVSPRGSFITLEARYDENTLLTRIDIIDAGSGVDPAVRENLFEPFVTTKGQRGTGLGLVVSRRIAERHGGTLECVRSGESGTVMRLELPSDSPGTEPGDTDGPRPLSEGGSDVRFGPPEH